MKYMGVNELREAYLKFFEGKQHLRIPSFSLVPHNDNSLLLINAGMAPLKPYFTGLQVPPSKRVTTCQKCIRTGDIDNVGKTSRHATFFEMLGNFSFGDYFKKEIIPWSWEFVTEVLGIPKDKLFVTVYEEDKEAYDIWSNYTDIEKSRIFFLGKKDNFWEHGVGPCGPCSEIHFDRGSGAINSVEEFEKASDEDRIIEFWNLVFTQFDKTEDGEYKLLKNPNIDTGMGLERIATIMQGVNSIFEIDVMSNIMKEVVKYSGKSFKEDENTDVSLRIITDHIRSITFLISDGVIPSNEGRGYVLRRLLRRAARHGRLLGLHKPFLHSLTSVVIENFGKNYGELVEKQQYIEKVIKLEEERFEETIDSGIEVLNSYIKELEEKGEKLITGDKTFRLYDTYGFPLELTEEILKEKGIELDMEGFKKEMQHQRETARAAREETNYMGSENTILNKVSQDINTEFRGYDKLKAEGKVEVIIMNESFVNSVAEGDRAAIITDLTPFYAEMGGQVGDTGTIRNDNFEAEVLDCRKNISGKIFHVIKVISGSLQAGDKVTLVVGHNRRMDIRRNHTATHILHSALVEVLGNHVHQAGSYVDDKSLRFDFTHFTAMTKEELRRVEENVNSVIMSALEVDTNIMSLKEAKESGAVALFGEKYKEDVRVVSVGNFSKELCGGTHVENSGEIGLFKIKAEYGVAAGVRRIEAVTGFGALRTIEEKEEIIENIATTLKCGERDIVQKLQANMAELKERDKEIASLKAQLAKGEEDSLLDNVIDIKGIKFLAGTLNNIEGETLRNLAEKLRGKLGEGIVLLGSSVSDKVQFVAMSTPEPIKRGFHCGKLIKEVAAIAGGGGGGRPDMAQAGGKLPEKLSEAMEKSKEVVEDLVK